MANGKSSSSARRREVRRNIGKQKSSFALWIERIDRKDFAWAFIFTAILTLAGGAMTIHSTEHPKYQVGQLITKPIVSRISFTSENYRQTEANRIKERDKTPNAYSPNIPFFELLNNQLNQLAEFATYDSVSQIPPADLLINNKTIPFTEQALQTLKKNYVTPDNKPNKQWEKEVKNYTSQLFLLAILEPQRYKDEQNWSSANSITAEHPNPINNYQKEMPHYESNLYSLDNAAKLEGAIKEAARYLPPDLQETIIAITLADNQPTYKFNEKLSRERKEKAYSSVPPEQRKINANEILIPAGQILTEDDRSLIDQEQEAYLGNYTADQMSYLPEDQIALLKERITSINIARVSTFGMFLLIATCVWVYIYTYNRRIVTNPMRGFALTTLLLLCQFLAIFSTRLWAEGVYATATFPALFATIILSIVYDQRFALAMGSALVAIIMLGLSLPIPFGLIIFAGIGICAAMLPNVNTRSTVVKVGAFAGVVLFISSIIIGLATQPIYITGEPKIIIINATLALCSGIFVGMCVQGVLPAIEAIFHVTTAMTLKDLNDASHPLLQRLAQEAPGTYQHSLRIADMTEGAAEAIGANALLCRVGAMYHDIGKINKPMYFIENQGGGPNRHSKLSPAMSLLIIVGHVKDGIEMAREYALPRQIRQFIETHHGTTLVEYFYHAAKKKKEAEEQAAPSEFEFRYPGPKPQTKEAAILLLCDGLEAAARTLPEPTPVRLEQLVSTISNKRLMDGQFSECNITLRELRKIEEAIVKTLCAVYHSRIKYPGGDKEKEESDDSHSHETKSSTA